MVKKKVDSRIRGLIEYNVRNNHRSFFILVGDHGKDQVENIHRILTKSRIKSRPNVLWCYKKELGFSTHRKKRMKEIKKAQSRGLHDADRDDPFDLFISSTDIRWTYYKESEKILGQTFGMCVLQDFEAVTPNLLARTIETVEGGGVVILLLKSVKSLTQLYTLTMDVHSRLRTESHHDIVPRFNERFILSLSDCKSCLVLDDELNILPISSSVEDIPTYEDVAESIADFKDYTIDPELVELKNSLIGTPHVSNLVELTKTTDQAKALMTFLDAVSERTLKSTVSLTAGRGRGKSASLGLCLAGAISYGYSNVFITAPSPENLKTCFEFVIAGLKALKYVEHQDFEIVQESFGDIGKVTVRVNIFRDHRQTIQYILPSDHQKLSQAELVAIDEAAAIPLPTVKKLLGPYLVFLSSTINGYEGTGRALSLKLLQQLRNQQSQSIAAAAHQQGQAVAGSRKGGKQGLHEERWKTAAAAASASGTGRSLIEIELNVPIRYSSGDNVEKWLNNLLCLDTTSHSTRLVNVMPAPKDCDLYLVDRDALFSYHPLSEAMLQRIWSLYTSAHYKNSPNDLQILSDAPAHRLFVLLGPQKNAQKKKDGSISSQLPDILCVVQVAFEGRISQKSVQSELQKGNKASGDLIPWTISQQFNDTHFAGLSGARIVRIATHPDVQKMGYGSRAIDLLIDYFAGKLTVETITPSRLTFGGEGTGSALSKQAIERSDVDTQGLLNEQIKPRSKLPPLLTNIIDRPAERLHYLGSSFGLTNSLLNFWSRKGFQVAYLRQTPNELTGEHSSIALRELDCSDLFEDGTPSAGWLNSFVKDYRKRLISLMSYNFRHLDCPLSLTLLDPERSITTGGNDNDEEAVEGVTLSSTELLTAHLSYYDMKRLELYSRNIVDHHMILDIVPTLATLLFQGKLGKLRLSYLQASILLAVGLQRRDIDSVTQELDLPSNQILAFFNKTIRKLSNCLKSIVEKEVSKEMLQEQNAARIEKIGMKLVPLKQSLAEELDNDGNDAKNKLKSQQKELLLSNKDISSHVIKSDANIITQIANESASRMGAIPSSISIPRQVVEESKNSDKKRKNHDDHHKNKKKNKH